MTGVREFQCQVAALKAERDDLQKQLDAVRAEIDKRVVWTQDEIGTAESRGWAILAANVRAAVSGVGEPTPREGMWLSKHDLDVLFCGIGQATPEVEELLDRLDVGEGDRE